MDRSVAEGVSYLAGHALNLENGGEAQFPRMASIAADKTALVHRLAAIQETSAQILDELLPENRFAATDGYGPQPQKLDAPSFERLHLQYQERLLNSLTGMVRDRNKAEEIAARAFEVAWEKRDTFQGNASPATWIEAIARNEARRSYRQDARPIESLDDQHVAEPAAPDRVADGLERRENSERLAMALAHLPVKERLALKAHFLEGLPVRDIAQRENVPVGTVLSRIHSGKQHLREALGGSPDRRGSEATQPGWSR